MRLEYKLFEHGGQWRFEVVDLDDTVNYGGEELPECVYESSRGWAREDTAERHAEKAVRKLELGAEVLDER